MTNYNDLVIVFNEKVSEYLKDTYSLNERINIHDAIKEIEENPNDDFKNLMNEAPKSHELSFSNEEIYNYLMNFKVFMENEDYGLLTGNRLTKEF